MLKRLRKFSIGSPGRIDASRHFVPIGITSAKAKDNAATTAKQRGFPAL
jgi:hypothetical protein